MHNLLSCRAYAVTLEYLRALRAAADKELPAVAPGTFATWMGMTVAHPDTWAARAAGRSAGDIAIIPVMGMLTLRGGWFGMSIEGLRQTLRAKLEDPNVLAIVMEYDSPGGEVFGVDEFATELRAARAQKPIVAVANPFAASAAYYLMAQASEVFVSPSAMIGSVGVYAGHVDWSRALDQAGITVTLISAGEGKIDGNEFEPLSEEARADIQGDIDMYYGMFAAAVAKGRGVPVEKVRSEWKALVYGAKEGAQLGLADQAGTFDDAVRRASAMASERRTMTAAVDREVTTRMRLRQRAGGVAPLAAEDEEEQMGVPAAVVAACEACIAACDECRVTCDRCAAKCQHCRAAAAACAAACQACRDACQGCIEGTVSMEDCAAACQACAAACATAGEICGDCPNGYDECKACSTSCPECQKRCEECESACAEAMAEASQAGTATV